MDALIPIFIFFVWPFALGVYSVSLLFYTLWIAYTHGLLLFFAFLFYLFRIYFCGFGREMERIQAQEFFVFV